MMFSNVDLIVSSMLLLKNNYTYCFHNLKHPKPHSMTPPQAPPRGSGRSCCNTCNKVAQPWLAFNGDVYGHGHYENP